MSTSHLNGSHSGCKILVQDVTEAGLSITSIFLLSNFVVGLPANVWVIWLICCGSREMLASEIYLLNLAVCEILFCLGLPGQLYCIYSFGHVNDVLSTLVLEMVNLVWIARPLFQSCVCVERYIAVVHPLIFIRFKTLKNKVAQCVVAWCVYSVTVLLLKIFPYSKIEFVMFVPTFCLLLFCCFSVLCSLKQPGPGEGKGKKRGDKMKRRAFNIILVHLAGILVNYLPFLTVQTLLTNQRNIPGIVTDFTLSLGMICGLVQPLFYLHRAGKLPCVREHRPEG